MGGRYLLFEKFVNVTTFLLFFLFPWFRIQIEQPHYICRQLEKKDFNSKQAYIKTVMRQQKVCKEHGAHYNIDALDNRPATRTGLSGYIAHRLESGLPVEPLKALKRQVGIRKNQEAEDEEEEDGENQETTLDLSSMGISDQLFLR